MASKKKTGVKRELAVRRSAAGLGLYAKAPIEKGGFVIEYTGVPLTADEANEKGGKYLFEVSKNLTIDGASRSNLARYINHSCRPNCEVDIRNRRILIFAKRAIKAGEELCYDYGKEYFDEYIKPHGCRCEKCREKAARAKNPG